MRMPSFFAATLLLLTGCTPTPAQNRDEVDGQGAARNMSVVPAAEVREKWALLVGSNYYLDREVGELSYCQDDVVAMKDYLVKFAGVPENHIVVLHDKQPQPNQLPMRLNIEQALEAFADLPGPGDQVLAVFSLHGIYLDGTSYLCPMEADRARPDATLLPIPWVYQTLESRCRAAQKIIILDTCRRSLRQSTRSAERQKSMSRDFAADIRRVPQGLCVLFSCGVEQDSYEDRGLRHGVFLNYILEGLSGQADTRGGNGNGQVDLEELFQFAKVQTRQRVLEKFRAQQTPEIQSQGEPSDIVLTAAALGPSSPDPRKPFDELMGRSLEEAEQIHVAKLRATIAVQQIEQGEDHLAIVNFRDALKLAEAIEDETLKDKVLVEIAKLQATAKQYVEATTTCGKITDKHQQCAVVCAIARLQAQNGDIGPAYDTLGIVAESVPDQMGGPYPYRAHPKLGYEPCNVTISGTVSFIDQCYWQQKKR